MGTEDLDHIKQEEERRSKAQNREEKERKTILKIIENYDALGSAIADQLTLSTPNHGVTTGAYREEVWKSLFEQIVPRKFYVDQGIFIIDSKGRISDEVDLAIFDEQYTPYIFKYGKIKFIPIEAVAVAIQCKSSKTDGASDWADSIKRLETSIDSVTRVISGLKKTTLETSGSLAQTFTRPILILCSLCEAFPSGDKIAKSFDMILNVDKRGRLAKSISAKQQDFNYWYKQLNHAIPDRLSASEKETYQKLIMDEEKQMERTLADLELVNDVEEENVILSLTFQLNQLLMIINNPIFFPHRSYVEMFRDHVKMKQAVKSSGSKGRGESFGKGERP